MDRVVNVVPYTNRRITIKSLWKVMGRFPEESIKIIGINPEYKKTKWAEKVARFFILRGRKVFVEFNDCSNFQSLDNFVEMGANLIFLWGGARSGEFLSSYLPVGSAIDYLEKNPQKYAMIKYCPIPDINVPFQSLEDIYTSIESLIKFKKKYGDRLHLIFTYPHPWSGVVTKHYLEDIFSYLDRHGYKNCFEIEMCGQTTVLPNTNVYACQYSPRRDRKKLFGNASRDKYTIGTLVRGQYREITNCAYCKRRGRARRATWLANEYGGENDSTTTFYTSRQGTNNEHPCDLN